MPVDWTIEADAFLTEFGESIEYHPAAEGARPRTITAVVDRQPEAELPGAGRGQAPTLTVFVKNDLTKGILADQLDTGGDKVKLPVRLGDDPELRPLVGIGNQAGFMIELEVR